MGYDRSDCWMTCGERDDKCAALKINDPFAEIEHLQAANRRWSKVADERSKENCALRQEVEWLRAVIEQQAGEIKRLEVGDMMSRRLRNAEQT